MTEPLKPVYLEDKLNEVRGDGHLRYRSSSLPTWCPGCGYFSVAEGVATALNRLEVPLKDAVVVSGIGCASRFPFSWKHTASTPCMGARFPWPRG